mgnify:FL=1
MQYKKHRKIHCTITTGHNMKPDKNKVHSEAARQAIINADGQRNAAYSQYILLMYRSTGRLAPGCDAKDLQAWYDDDIKNMEDAQMSGK